MFQRWSNFLVKQHIIEPEDAEIQEYGLFCLVETVAFHLAQLLLAILVHRVPESLLFDATFLLLRSHTGGYHAETPARCFVLSIAVWAGVIWMSQWVPTMLCLILGILSIGAIWKLAPLPHENNPYSPERLRQVTIHMRVILLLFAGLTAILFALKWMIYARLVLLVLVCTAVSLYIAWRKTAKAEQ